MTATTSAPASINVGGGTGEHGQFQVAAAIGAAAFQLDRIFVEVFEESASDGSEINKVIVPVIYGPRIVADYIGFRIHTREGRRHAVQDLPAALWRPGAVHADRPRQPA